MADSSWRSRILRWGPVMLWMAGLFWGSSLVTLPPIPGLDNFRWVDKLQHGVAYSILALFVWRALVGRNLPQRAIIALLICTLYGITDELHQACVPVRECSLGDWIADTIGAAVAVALLYLKYRKPKMGGDYHVR